MAISSPSPICILGRQILVRGHLQGQEDLLVEGRLEGSVNLAAHLAIAESGVVRANLEVNSVEIEGELVGDVVAVRSITIKEGARVQGNVRAPQIVIEDGAHFQGSVDMVFDLPESL